VTMRHMATRATDVGTLTLAVVVRLETLWVWLLTCPIPGEVRDRHRAEREAHLLDHLEYDEAAGCRPLRTAARIFLRFLVGIPEDIVFCVSQACAGNGRSKEADTPMTRRQALGGIAVAALILVLTSAALVIRGPEHPEEPGHVSPAPAERWLVGVGGEVALVAGVWVLWTGSWMPRWARLGWGIGLALVGLYLVHLGMYPR